MGRRPKTAAQIIDHKLGYGRLKTKRKEYEFFARWPQIVGPEIAAVTLPEKILRGSTLVVRVLDDAWTQELTLRSREILRLLLDNGVHLAEIKFLTGNPQQIRRRSPGTAGAK